MPAGVSLEEKLAADPLREDEVGGLAGQLGFGFASTGGGGAVRDPPQTDTCTSSICNSTAPSRAHSQRKRQPAQEGLDAPHWHCHRARN